MPITNAKRILDLCAGSGNLLAAARQKWMSALLIGIDIDPNAVVNCQNRFSKPALFTRGDARLLCPGLINKDCPELAIDSFDVVLANPPFTRSDENRSPTLIPANFDPSHLIVNWETLCRRIEAQLLVYNTLYVRNGGYLVAIIPNSVLSCDRFASLRKWLVAQSESIKVIRLPEKIFHKSEVSASALILKRKLKAHPKKVINFTLQEAKFHSGILVPKTLYKGKIGPAHTRLDLTCISGELGKRSLMLSEFASVIKRGTFIPKSSLSTTGSCHYIHSTHIKDIGLDMNTNSSYVTDNKAIMAGVHIQRGDILLVRVGRTLGRIGVVINSNHSGLISSCLFLIRPNGIDPYSLSLLLQCEISQKYFYAVARGAAARFLTYEDIRKMPIPSISFDSLTKHAKEYEAALNLPAEADMLKRSRAARISSIL